MSARDFPPPLGWPLLPVPVDGRLIYPSLEESVRQSIQIILLTRPGERLMRPDFGAGLDRFLHEPNTLSTRRRIRDTIAQALTQWEQRLVLDNVDVSELSGQPQTVRVGIAYRIRRTGVAGALSLSMDVGG